jgi:5-bromo-4-chloroindolyl phosphate hydrolysis protein
VTGLAFLVATVAGGTFFLGTAIPIICVFIFFLYLVGLGTWARKRLHRVRRYVELCNGKPYINIEDLAKQYGKSIRFVRNDIVKMLGSGFFPEGHLDRSKSCLMLTDSTYREYLQLEKEREVQEEQREAKVVTATYEDSKDSSQIAEDIREMLEQGNMYINRIHLANDRLPGEVVSDKLAKLEKLLLRIFDRIRERNLEAAKMRKFMDYYLPTTLKLVDAYEEFDRVDVSNKELLAAKSEIENTLDTIIEAFNEVLTNLYRDAVFDATTDAQVLQSMLAREGLTGANDMKK